MRTSRIITATAAIALAAAGATATTTAADAARADSRASSALARGLFSPLSAAIGPNGTAYVAQNFAGQIVRIEAGRKPKPVFSVRSQGDEAGAVSLRRGVLTFAVTEADGGAVVKQRGRNGRIRTIANLKKYERTVNPDGDVSYGIDGISGDCAAQFPAQGAPASYTGIVESHPYATAMSRGRTFVADAAGNAILAISRTGKVSTVAVLPAVPVEITADLAAGLGLPECAVGETYDFEPVPTDVEVGPGGRLFVSTLPGGPEDGSAGPLAAVYRVNPTTGTVTRVADGLVSAVGVAVDRTGAVYASQLFGGTIARIKDGKVSTFARTAMPGDVEVRGGAVYATVNVLSGMSGEPGDAPNGKLVRFRG